jgi:hypothetical protein
MSKLPNGCVHRARDGSRPKMVKSDACAPVQQLLGCALFEISVWVAIHTPQSYQRSQHLARLQYELIHLKNYSRA